MSTLPFLLSVADELDNINSQSYMDDFGLGFHPHRQYYRTPTIQLSLPASTDWMQHERQQRYRSHKFYEETQNNHQTTGEDDDGDGENDEDKISGNAYETSMERYMTTSEPSTSAAASASASAAASSSGRQKYACALNSNRIESHADATTTKGNRLGKTTKIKSGNRRSGTVTAIKEGNLDMDDDDDDDNIDNSVRMYNLSKKCCKNYHRHAIETNAKNGSGHIVGGGTGTGGTGGTVSTGGSGGGASVGSYRLHSKCMEGNNSSSDESLQKVSSSIEFLTCFLLKRSRASSSSSSSRNATTGSTGAGSNSKKS